MADNGEEHKEQVEDHLIANEDTIKILAKNDNHVEKFGKDGRYPKKKWRPPGEWWKKHILPQHGD